MSTVSSTGVRDDRDARTLAFTLAVRGPLCAEALEGGLGARFISESGQCALTYSGPVAFDADGRALPATIDATQDSILIHVDDRSARYPITIDPIAQQAYLKASNPGNSHWFGWAVSACGDTAVVGAPLKRSDATGVDGDQANDGAFKSGAAYVFVRKGQAWLQQAYLKASNTGAEDYLGASVSVSGNTIAIGAFGEDRAATGANGDQASNAATNSGAVYVFRVQSPCPADLDGDGTIDGADLAVLLAAWGPARPPARPGMTADLNGDGAVSGADLGMLLAAWGTCGE